MNISHAKVSRQGYTVLKDWVLDRQDLTGNEKLAYMALCRFANKSGECYPSYAAIAERMSCSRKTAKRAIQSLVGKGLITLEQRMDTAGDPTSHLYAVQDEKPQGVGTELPQGGVTATPPVGSQLPPKDSQSEGLSLKDQESPPPAPVQRRRPAALKDPLAAKIDDTFWGIHEYTNIARERGQIAQILRKCRARDPADPETVAMHMLAAFAWLRQNGDQFWRRQPFTPSMLSSQWDRIEAEIEERSRIQEMSRETAEFLGVSP